MADLIGAAIRATLAHDGPAVCEVMLDAAQPFSPRVSSKRLPDGTMVTGPLEDMFARLEEGEPRGEYACADGRLRRGRGPQRKVNARRATISHREPARSIRSENRTLAETGRPEPGARSACGDIRCRECRQAGGHAAGFAWCDRRPDDRCPRGGNGDPWTGIPVVAPGTPHQASLPVVIAAFNREADPESIHTVMRASGAIRIIDFVELHGRKFHRFRRPLLVGVAR